MTKSKELLRQVTEEKPKAKEKYRSARIPIELADRLSAAGFDGKREFSKRVAQFTEIGFALYLEDQAGEGDGQKVGQGPASSAPPVKKAGVVS